MKKIKKLLDKKLIKITGIIISLFILFILVEYGYSQRWRLEKDVGVENYSKAIITGSTGWYWNPHFFARGIDEFVFNIDDKIEFYYIFDGFYITLSDGVSFPTGLNFLFYDWEIQENIFVLINRKMQFDNPEDQQRFPENTQKTIYHLGKNYLVFDEKDNSVMFPFIPRKRMYMQKSKQTRVENFFYRTYVDIFKPY